MRSILQKRGQQEIAGFVLIVLLVVVALLVFLVISAKKETVAASDKSIENLLSSLMSYTSECVVKEPSYESIRELIQDCYKDNSKKCKNNGQPVCEYLNETVAVMLPILLKTESSVSAYEMRAYYEDDDVHQEILNVKGGRYNLTNGSPFGASEMISSEDGIIKTTITVIVEN